MLRRSRQNVVDEPGNAVGSYEGNGAVAADQNGAAPANQIGGGEPGQRATLTSQPTTRMTQPSTVTGEPVAAEEGPVYEEPLNPGATRAIAGLGAFTIIVGAWAGIVPFVGPLFGYGATGTKSFVWNLEHGLLWFLPGAVAVLLGIIMLSRASLVGAGLSRGFETIAGLVVACCGAWLVIGPTAWRVMEGRGAFTKATPWRSLLNQLGYSFVPGALLAVLGGAAIGAILLVERGAMPARLHSARPVASRRAA